MSIIAFIPARCGSKSIPGKNIRSFFGKPLIYWTMRAVEETPEIESLVIATDCDEIENICSGFGFSKLRIYRRSAENASDTSTTESVMLEYIREKKIKEDLVFILVQATNPFTTAKNLSEAISLMNDGETDSVISCASFKRFIWSSEGRSLNYDYRKRPRRQDFDQNFIENGAFYISRVRDILSSGNRLSGHITIYEMPGYTQLELDEESDWTIGESLMSKYLTGNSENFDELKVFLSDIDGVLTDGGMYYTEEGDEMKKFHTYDGMGFGLLKEKGIKTGLITGEMRVLNRKRYEKLQLDYFFPGARDKLSIVRELCKELDIDLKNVAYIGDDINDAELLSNVGFPACPSSAQDMIKSIPGIRIMSKEGGNGAVREFINQVLGYGR